MSRDDENTTTELERYIRKTDVPAIFEKRHPSEIPDSELPIILWQADGHIVKYHRGDPSIPIAEGPMRLILKGEDDPFGRSLTLERLELSTDSMNNTYETWVNDGEISGKQLAMIQLVYAAVSGVLDKPLTWTPGLDDVAPEGQWEEGEDK